MPFCIGGMNPTQTPTAEARRLIEESQIEADALPFPDMGPTKLCGRCGGKGYDYFTGTERAPAVCFRCAGAGKVPVKAGAYKAACEARQAARLVVLVRGLSAALDAVRPAALAGDRAAARTLRDIEGRLANPAFKGL